MAAVLAWLGVSGIGLWALAADSFEPGEAGVPQADWPIASDLVRSREGATVVVALHPECPCSEATVQELDRLVARSGTNVRIYALCVQYDGLPEPIEASRIWKQVGRIPGVVRVMDRKGREARKFAALTSGEVRLYGPAGGLLFYGGITASRGHVGDNPGQAAVLALIRENHPPGALPVSTPVFGCAL